MSEQLNNTIKQEADSEHSGKSKSALKREAIKKGKYSYAKDEPKKLSADSIATTIIGIILAGAMIFLIAMGIWSKVDVAKSIDNYAQGYAGVVDENGYIIGAKLDKVKDLNLGNLVVPANQVEYSDEDVEADISNMLDEHTYTDDSKDYELKKDDVAVIDYVGSIDGVVFEGGSAEDYELTLGSGSFIDTFEQQLIGSHPGDHVTVNVSFPDPYENNPDLAGKPAVFEVDIKGVSITPELTDAFVKENFSEYASTVDEYKAYLKKTGYDEQYDEKVKEYIESYISDNASADSIPAKYIKAERSIEKFNDINEMNYTNNMYMQFMGYAPYGSLLEFAEAETEHDYEKQVKDRAKKAATSALTYEKYFKDNGLTVPEEAYAQKLEEMGEGAEETYGKPYISQAVMVDTVIEDIKSKVTIGEAVEESEPEISDESEDAE